MLHKNNSPQVVKPSLCPCLPKTLNPEPDSTITSNAAMFKHSLTCMPPSPEANFLSTQMTRHSLICIRYQILYSMMFEEEDKAVQHVSWQWEAGWFACGYSSAHLQVQLHFAFSWNLWRFHDYTIHQCNQVHCIQVGRNNPQFLSILRLCNSESNFIEIITLPFHKCKSQDLINNTHENTAMDSSHVPEFVSPEGKVPIRREAHGCQIVEALLLYSF